MDLLSKQSRSSVRSIRAEHGLDWDEESRQPLSCVLANQLQYHNELWMDLFSLLPPLEQVSLNLCMWDLRKPQVSTLLRSSYWQQILDGLCAPATPSHTSLVLKVNNASKIDPSSRIWRKLWLGLVPYRKIELTINDWKEVSGTQADPFSLKLANTHRQGFIGGILLTVHNAEQVETVSMLDNVKGLEIGKS